MLNVKNEFQRLTLTEPFLNLGESRGCLQRNCQTVGRR